MTLFVESLTKECYVVAIVDWLWLCLGQRLNDYLPAEREPLAGVHLRRVAEVERVESTDRLECKSCLRRC